MQSGKINHEGIAHEIRMGRDPRFYVPPSEMAAIHEWESQEQRHESNYRVS